MIFSRGHWQRSTHRSWGISWSRIEPGLRQGKACSTQHAFVGCHLPEISHQSPQHGPQLWFFLLSEPQPRITAHLFHFLLDNLESSRVVSTQTGLSSWNRETVPRTTCWKSHSFLFFLFFLLSFRTSVCASLGSSVCYFFCRAASHEQHYMYFRAGWALFASTLGSCLGHTDSTFNQQLFRILNLYLYHAITFSSNVMQEKASL